jgi:hypothetical protein
VKEIAQRIAEAQRALSMMNRFLLMKRNSRDFLKCLPTGGAHGRCRGTSLVASLYKAFPRPAIGALASRRMIVVFTGTA